MTCLPYGFNNQTSSTRMPRCFGLQVCAYRPHLCAKSSHTLLASEQVQLLTQHLVLVPARAVWLVQHQLVWGAWRGTAGTTAGVNNTQWSPSLISQSLLVHIPTTHLLPGWFGLLKWCWEYLRRRCHSPTVCGSPSLRWNKSEDLQDCSCTHCHLQKMEYCSEEGSSSWWHK